MADLLCTIAQVKARAGITDSSDDAMLTEMATEVSGWIEAYTGRRLAPDNAATYVFDTKAGTVLNIPYGVRSVTSMGVAQTHQPDTGGVYTTIPAADIILRPKVQDGPIGWPFTSVRITRGKLAGTVSTFSTCENGCTITGNFGFATVPPDIESVAIDAVVTAYSTRGNGASGVIGADAFAGPPWSQYFSKGSPQRGTLDRYAVSGF
jgi:hypothetical protein